MHFPKNNYPLILNTQQLLWTLAQSNLQSITPVCSLVWEAVRVPGAQQAVPWPVFAACCKGLNGAPQGRRGWAEARGLWYVTIRSVPVSQLHNSIAADWRNAKVITSQAFSSIDNNLIKFLNRYKPQFHHTTWICCEQTHSLICGLHLNI